MSDEIEFDDLVDLHAEVKTFKTIHSAKTLAAFCSQKQAKFNRTNQETESPNLSSTTTCTYAYTQYIDLWHENGINESKIGFECPEKYWNFITKRLTNPEPKDELPDEFSILNILSLLKRIRRKINEGQSNQKVIIGKGMIDIVKALRAQYDKEEAGNDGFAFVENPHPFIYYKFSIIIEDWKKELDLTENEYKKYLKKLFNAGKYELYRQIALYDAKDETLFDVKRLVYSILTVQRNGKYSNNFIIDKAFEIIFKKQLETGLLPIGHVVDNDFVLENGVIVPREVSASPILSSFECFSNLLSDKNTRKYLKKYHSNLRRAYEWASNRIRNQAGEGIGWYPEYESTHEPVSWVTSPILLFLKRYCELLSELISDSASRYLKAEKVENQKVYDTYRIKSHIASMIKKYNSAYLIGPSGAEKSSIARYLAKKIQDDDPEKGQWKYVELTPGLFLNKGPDEIIPTANEIFKRLNRIRKAVLFFDAVDQLVKANDINANNANSSEIAKKDWVVTVLLSKLATLRKQKDIRFILATNEIDNIDTTAYDAGIVDLVLPMGGICWEERVRLLEEMISVIQNNELKEALNDMMFQKEKYSDVIEKLKKGSFNNAELSDLANFLKRTNFMSLLRIEQNLERMFDQPDYANLKGDKLYAAIKSNIIYQTFFSSQQQHENLYAQHIESSYYNLQKTLQDPKKRSKLVLPAEYQKQRGNIVKENPYT